MSPPLLRVRVKRRKDWFPTSWKHMQTCKHNLRGGNRKFGFMSTVTNPQVSSNEHTHTAMESSLNRHWISRREEISRSILFLSFLLSFCILHQALLVRVPVGSFFSFFLLVPHPPPHTLMGRVWLICCRTISWLLSGLFLLCPGSVPPSRSRSLPTQRHTGQRRGHSHFKQKIQLIITRLSAFNEGG